MFLCDRMMVLHTDRLVSEYPRGAFDRFVIGADMVGASHD